MKPNIFIMKYESSMTGTHITMYMHRMSCIYYVCTALVTSDKASNVLKALSSDTAGEQLTHLVKCSAWTIIKG